MSAKPWVGNSVIIVDDSPMVRSDLSRMYESIGMKVKGVAENGVVGLDLVRKHKPDLVSLDLIMPEMDGFAMVEALRADPRTATIPIIVLTSKTMTADEKAMLNGRISHLARKGDFNRAEFLALVRGLFPAVA